MALKTEVPKKKQVMSTTGAAAVDLSSGQYLAVIYTGSVSAGRPTFSLPGGQGVRCAGILQENKASGELAEVMLLGTSAVVANGTFDAGAELTPAGTSGKLEAASSGDYVCAIALEASAEANHEISAQVVSPYQKN